jgi:serine/threonine-protein kinase
MTSTYFTCPNGHPVEAADTVCTQCGTIRGTLPIPLGTGLPTVPGYEVLDVLGKGGMGVVYKARQLSLDRLVALKMIRDGALAGAEERKRFQAEAQAAARLQHPHVVQVFEVSEFQGQPYFSLELLSGGSLAEQLHGTPQPPRDAARLVEVLARAVQAAHQQGIIHRDLKPANVLLTREGVPKVVDFGLARRLDAGTCTQSGVILGTPSYMAPEQASGRSRDMGPATDVYALGAILYEMLVGHPPFRGETPLDTMNLVLTQEVVSPRRLQPKVPRDLETICLKCLRKEPRHRYASAEALAEDLRRFQAGEPIQARPAGPVERLAGWCRRHPGVAILAALLILVFSTGLAGVSWKWREAELHKLQAEARAEAEAQARADEAVARQKAEQAEKATAEALRYITATSIPGMFAGQGSANLSLLARVRKQPQVVKSLEHACTLGEQLLSSAAHPRIRLTLTEQYAQLAVLQAALGQRAEVIRSCRRALQLLDEVNAAEREAFADPKGLALSCFLIGAVLMNLQEHAQAVPAFTQAVEQQRRFWQEQPADRDRRKILSRYYFHLAHVQREAGRLTQSAATSLERLELWPAEADEMYDVACELLFCAAKIVPSKTETGLSPAQQEQRRRFIEQAMNVLRKAVASGLKDAAAVRRDPNLAPLRGRDDFRKLVEEMAARERRR